MRGGRHGRAAQTRSSGLAARMPQSFRTSRRVEFRDTDAAGIVHFSVFFTWMEAAEHELLRSLGLSVVLEGRDRHDHLATRGRTLRLSGTGPLRGNGRYRSAGDANRRQERDLRLSIHRTTRSRRHRRDDDGLLPHRIGRHLPLDRHSRADPPGPGHLQVGLKRPCHKTKKAHGPKGPRALISGIACIGRKERESRREWTIRIGQTTPTVSKNAPRRLNGNGGTM